MRKTLLGLGFLALASCGGGSTATTNDLSVKQTGDLAAPTGDLAASTFLVVEMCAESDYIDARTDATARTITPWNTSLGKKCLHITAGQSVTWDGVPNANHPLEPHDAKSTQPNPIADQGTNAFATAGTYGFDCEIHHSLMHGAIWVDAQ